MFFRVITTLWILFGASPDDPDSMVSRLTHMESRVSEAVPDQSRAAKVFPVLAEMKRAVALFHTEVDQVREQLILADADYTAGAKGYREVFRELDTAWIHAETRFLELRTELRGLITRPEWKKLFSDALRPVR